MSEWHGYAKVLSAKEKKKENENCRCLDETQNLCKKTGRVFFLATTGLIAVTRE